jgi:hypothetical protein
MYRLTQVLRLAIVRARPQKNPVPPNSSIFLILSMLDFYIDFYFIPNALNAASTGSE